MMEELRTPSPLRDADFAAVRARVRAEIARRKERNWFWPMLRFASAALLVALAFGLTLTPKKSEPVKPSVPVIASKPEPRPEPQPQSDPQPDPQPDPPRPKTYARASTRTQEPMTIHIQTADPEIRIIWIVNPST